MTGLLGRSAMVETLGRLLDGGSTVLLYGPVGAGKTSVLHALDARARGRGTPRGLSATTRKLGDLTDALARAYPLVDAQSGTTRQVRSRLRNAIAASPAVVLLDHLGETGTAFKGALKSMRGTGLGVLLAADVEHSRDHDRVRGLRLTHREIELPSLHGSTMRALLQMLLAKVTLPFPLVDEELRAVIAATDGLPGRAVDYVQGLKDPIAWRGAKPRVGWLRSEAAIAAAERYRSG